MGRFIGRSPPEHPKQVVARFSDGGINCGKKAAINLDPSSLYYFEVELDNEPGVH